MKTYCLTLEFDKQTNDLLQSFIDSTAEACGNDYMLKIGIAPHVSLGLYYGEDDQTVKTAVDKLADSVRSGKIIFDSIGSFGHFVVFAKPVKNEYLKESNEFFVRHLSERFPPADNGNYLPDNWIPHCTIACKLDEDSFPKALEEARKIPLPITAKTVKLILAECDPYREFAWWDLV
jgi:hypothetical protein